MGSETQDKKVEEPQTIKIADLRKDVLEKLPKEDLIVLATEIFVVMSPESGYGFGICSFGNMMRWNIHRTKKDWGSIVGTKAPLDRYTSEELVKMLLFAQKMTAHYDKYFRWRQGANILILNKDEFRWKGEVTTRWMVKRLSWEFGKFYHDTLDDAINYITKTEERDE